MTEKSILYIEDEEDYQMLVQRILDKAGCKVTIAENGQQGMELLRRQRPDLLILDINLPDTDGYTICNTLRQDSAYVDLPILMLTVRRRPEEWLKGFSCGANDYVAKPLDPPELINRVRTCLAAKQDRFTRKASARAEDEAPEYQLIQAAVSGNRAAYEVLIQKYQLRLRDNMSQVVRDNAIEDVLSHAFTRAYERLELFRGDSSFYTWLYRIAINEALNTNRGAAAVSLEELSQGDESALPAILSEEESMTDNLAEEESAGRVREALALVEEPYRRMLSLQVIGGLSYEAISQRLRIPVGTVMSRMFKARRLLQSAWKKNAKSVPG